MNIEEIQPQLNLLSSIWKQLSLQKTPWKGFAVNMEKLNDGTLQSYIDVYCDSQLPAVVQELIDASNLLRAQPILRVVKAPNFVALGGPGVALSQSDIVAGAQISTVRKGARPNVPLGGTLGAFLRKKGDERIWLLSAGHIIAPDKEKETKSVVLLDCAAGASNILSTDPPQTIPLDGLNAPADAAVVPISPGNNTRISLALDGLRDRQPIDINANLTTLTQIHKTGSTSGSSSGGVTSIQATVTVEIPPIGEVVLTNQFLSPINAAPGDSGSLAIDTNSGRPLGLLVAQSSDGSQTVISPMAAILQALVGDFSLLIPTDQV